MKPVSHTEPTTREQFLIETLEVAATGFEITRYDGGNVEWSRWDALTGALREELATKERILAALTLAFAQVEAASRQGVELKPVIAKMSVEVDETWEKLELACNMRDALPEYPGDVPCEKA